MDWISFLEDHNIPYVTRSKNTKKGEISIKCPFCGDEDPSEHCGISLTREVWGCYRNAEHRGFAAHRLISGLTGLTSERAKALARAYSRSNADDLGVALAALTGASKPAKPAKPKAGLEVVNYPDEFRPIKRTGLTAKFWHYLHKRGFDDVDDLVDRYNLCCALSGRYRYRVILPAYKGTRLVGWTGRLIVSAAEAPRYLASGEAIKKVVFNEDNLTGGRLLFITEGPFDALKLDYYGEPLQARATCLFGTSFTMDQIYTLNVLRRRFKKVVILLDRDAVGPAFQAADWLQGPNVSVGSLPDGVKDPGMLSWTQVEDLIGREL